MSARQPLVAILYSVPLVHVELREQFPIDSAVGPGRSSQSPLRRTLIFFWATAIALVSIGRATARAFCRRLKVIARTIGVLLGQGAEVAIIG